MNKIAHIISVRDFRKIVSTKKHKAREGGSYPFLSIFVHFGQNLIVLDINGRTFKTLGGMHKYSFTIVTIDFL